MQRRHGIAAARQLQRQHRHAEIFVGVVGIHPAPGEELIVALAQPLAQRAQVLFDQSRRKPVMPGRYRRMRGENDVASTRGGRPPRR